MSVLEKVEEYWNRLQAIITIAQYLISTIRITPKQRLALRATVLTVSFLLVRLIIRKRAKYIPDLQRITKKIGTEQKEVEYDVIIVGGGTAGCALAARLTEDPNIRVLLIEAGGSGKSLLFSRIPSAFPLLFRGSHVHQYHTTPQPNAGGDQKFWPRAKMLGGCSAINAMIAQYGSPSDFDEWAKIIGDESWGWSQFQESFRKFERYSHDKRYPETDHTKRGGVGPVTVGFFNHLSKGCDEFIKGCVNVGIPFVHDFNTTTGTKGVNRVLTYVDKRGERVTAETAYLTKRVLARKNLTVAIHAQVTKVLTIKKGGELRTVGVELQNKRGGARFRARAKHEVVLCAGAINTPQLLMLSGIGPSEELKKFGIKQVVDLKGVGASLIDHPVVDLYFAERHGASIKSIKPANLSDVGPALKNIVRYFYDGKGVFATNLCETACFVRSDDTKIFPADKFTAKIEDSTSGPDGPDIEILSSALAYKNHGDVILSHIHTFSLHVILLRPTSSGAVQLATASAWDAPLMDPKYGETSHDIDVLVRGVRLALNIARTEPLASFLDNTDRHKELDHLLHLKTDEELEQVVRKRIETLYHPACTARMAPKADGGVVDSKLRVYGVSNLRVCDASAMPTIVSGHTAGACLAMAEKLADIMKAEFALKH